MAVIIKKKRKGFFLLQTALAMIVIGMLAHSLFTIYSGQFSMIQASRTAFQAQQYAEVDANVLQLVDYDDVDDYVHIRQPIDVSKIITAAGWEDEISITPETVVDVAQNTRQRIATVKIYKTGDTLARYSVEVPLSTKGRGGYPVGSIIAWPLASAPLGVDAENWLECNGQTVNVGKYPKLAKLMSAVPDYRGIFLRGLGGNSSTLGSTQGDAIRNITGYFRPFAASTAGIMGQSGAFDIVWSDSDIVTGTTDQLAHDSARILWEYTLYFDASRCVPTANENRPINKSVRYMIKAR